MGMKSRRKGDRAEREVAELLGVERNARLGSDDQDLALGQNSPVCVEVKIRQRGRGFALLYVCIEQALRYRPHKMPLAFVREDDREWLVIMRWSDAHWLRSMVEDAKREEAK